MRGKQKRIIRRAGKGAMAAILCALLLGGCGKEPAAEDVPVQSAAEQKQTAGEKTAGQEEQIGQEAAGQEQAAREKTAEQEEQIGQEQEEQTGQKQTVAQQKQAAEDGNSQNREETTDEAAEKDSMEHDIPTAQSVTWEGVVKAAGVSSFTVSEIFTEVMENGAMIAVEQLEDENEELIEVSYTDQTVFTIRTTYNGGMSHSDSAGSNADLKEDVSCILTGSWDGDVFGASEVVIYDHQ